MRVTEIWTSRVRVIYFEQAGFWRTTMSSASLTRGAARAYAHTAKGKARALATHAALPEKDCSSITPPYPQLQAKLNTVREILGGRPLTLAEKILYSHIHNPKEALADGKIVRGETYLQLNPERVAMQDASAQYVDY